MTRTVLLALALSACADQRLIQRPDWDGWVDDVSAERVPFRVATWNLQGVGAVDSSEFDATARILARLDADVVGLQEIDDAELDALDALATAAGYDVVFEPPEQPFGSLGNAVLSRLPSVSRSAPDGAELSGDASAEDVTRRPMVFTVDVPGTAQRLTVVSQHWKSGFEPDDVFRRVVDTARTVQAAQTASDSDLVLILGDVNEEPGAPVGVPAAYTSTPDLLPATYALGSDLQAVLGGDGLANDPYGLLADAGFRPIDAAQRDGEVYTRPTSGRRLDIVFGDAAVRTTGLSTEVYDSVKDRPGEPGLADAPPRPEQLDSLRASDHLPVLVELRLPTAE